MELRAGRAGTGIFAFAESKPGTLDARKGKFLFLQSRRRARRMRGNADFRFCGAAVEGARRVRMQIFRPREIRAAQKFYIPYGRRKLYKVRAVI